VPVIEIGASTYPHKDYGKVHVPVFKIVDWVEQAEYLAMIAAAKAEATTEATEAEAAPKKAAPKPAKGSKMRTAA
jgi:hypothetical protein